MTGSTASFSLPAWTAAEQPTFPGSPAFIAVSTARRVVYVLISVLCGLTTSLGNALVTANLATMEGNLALTQVEGQWLIAAYLMTNVSANLVLIKLRQQFGIRLFAIAGTAVYAAVILLHLLVASYGSALVVRAVAGIAAAPLNTITTLYMLQAFGRARVTTATILAISLIQVGIPLASVIGPPLIDLGEAEVFYQLEAGLALLTLGAILAVRLPKSIRVDVITRRDIPFLLTVPPALALLVAVLEQGRLQWWTNQVWIGVALAVAIPLLVIGLSVERLRTDPVFNTRFATSFTIARFVFGAVMLRMLLSEQSFAAVGLLRQLQMGPDQLQPLYLVILGSFLLGVALAAWSFRPGFMPAIIVVTAGLIAAGALIDSHATSETRPHDMFLSQGLIGVASGLFVGPLLINNITAVFKSGYQNLITFIVLFSASQSVGAAAANALFSTYQVNREHVYSTLITADIDPTNPVVQQRLLVQRNLYAGVIGDPAVRAAEGYSQLGQTATREANVRAYEDVIKLIAGGAILFLLLTLPEAVRMLRHPPDSARPQPGPAPPNTIGAG